MVSIRCWLGCIVVAAGLTAPAADPGGLRLHPKNPRIFEFRDQPLLIVGSGEHYGVLVNPDFDFRKYFATQGADGLNHTRIFSGAAYVEPQGAFNIERNTLAPAGERFLAPWARSDQPGYAGGGARFDLNTWNEDYFVRLREIVKEADRHHVIVEFNLFCPFYEESQWRLSPFHPANNIQDAGSGVHRTNVYTLDRHGGLLAWQEKFVDRVVDELKWFGNVYYEICNEPYFGGVTLEWQAHIARRIAAAQAGHEHPKLISQNIANGKERVPQPLEQVSVYNFHYATPPDTVALNWHLQRPIGDNETGFRGTNDAPYRMEAWDFMVAGGALFSHLDYSFTVGHEDGTFPYPGTQPGGGNPGLRRQFRFLREFLSTLDPVEARPDTNLIRGGVPVSHTARALSHPTQGAALYFRPLSTGQFSVRWTGVLEIEKPGDYTIHAAANDGIRVWIRNRPVIDQWVEQTEQEHSGTVTLEAGSLPIRVEYFYNGGQAAAKLAWSGPGFQRTPIPPSAFRLPDRSGPGLRGEYFSGRDFNEPWRERVDRNIQFSWGGESPFPVPAGAAREPLLLNLEPGHWRMQWFDPATGRKLSTIALDHRSSVPARIALPEFKDDLAGRLLRN